MSFIKYILSFCLLIPPFILNAQDTLYYPNSRSIQFITVVNGAAKTVTGFHRDGVKVSEQHYLHDTLHGMSQIWTQYGGLIEESIYDRGIQVSRKTWDYQLKPTLEEYYEIVDSTRQRQLHGPYLTWQKGLPLIQGNYLHGEKHGRWRSYYNTGTLRAVENLEHGLLKGKVVYYQPNGELARISNYKIQEKDGRLISVLDGPELVFDRDGSRSERTNYKNGKKHGRYTSWYPDGKLKIRSNFFEGYQHGKVRTWHANGGKRFEYSMKYISDTLKENTGKSVYDGEYREYFDDGKLRVATHYRDGQYHGVKREYYPTGKIHSEQFYEDGLITGLSTSWNGIGVVMYQSGHKIISDSQGKRSVNHGIIVRYLQDGTPSLKGNYVEGLKDGLWQEWYNSGQLASEKHFCLDRLCGSFTTWHENGQPETVRQYGEIKDSKGDYLPTGKELQYNQDGVLRYVKYFDKHSRLHLTRSYYPDGTLLSEEWDLMSHQIGSTGINWKRLRTFFPDGKLESDLTGSRYQYAAGRNVTWYMNGTIKSIVDLNRIGGKSGLEIIYGSDGSVIYFKNHEGDKPDTALALKLQERYSAAYGKQETSYTTDSILVTTTFYEIDILALIHGIRDSLTQGPLLAFYPDGDTLLSASFDQGVPHGKYASYLPDGNPSMIGSFEDGKPAGKWQVYFDNGIKKEEVVYQPDTTLIGSYKEWWENGKIKQEYANRGDKTHGKWAEYFYNGEPRYISHYVDGKLEGEFKSFWENGNPHNFYHSVNGEKHGPYQEWYQNGNPKVSSSYQHGVQDGLYKAWWENGNLRLEGNYAKGLQEGIWTIYNEDGSFRETRFYRSGQLVLTPSEISCSCIDSTSGKLRYAPPLSSMAELDLVRKMSFNFHAPLDSFYNDLFYINMYPNHSRDAISYSIQVVAFEPVYLKIPNEQGLKLVFNPCPSAQGHGNRIPLYLHAQNNDKSSLSIHFSPEYGALEFDPIMLHPWNSKTGKPFRDEKGLVASQVQFRIEGISYNSREKLKLEKISDACFPLSEIGNTKVLLEFDSFIPDLDLKRNPYELEIAIGLYADKFNKHFSFDTKEFLFTGLIVPKGTIKILDTGSGSAHISGESRQLLLSNHLFMGVFSLKAIPGKNLYYEVVDDEGKTRTLTTDQIAERLENSGFRVMDIVYNTEQSALLIYLFYSKR